MSIFVSFLFFLLHVYVYVFVSTCSVNTDVYYAMRMTFDFDNITRNALTMKTITVQS